MRRLKRLSICGNKNPNYKHGLTHNKKCPDCGKNIVYYASKCRSCSHIKEEKDKSSPYTLCLDCGKQIWKPSKRCRSCSSKGSLAHNWRGGKAKYLPVCEICGKKLSQINYKRCTSCNKLGNKNPMFGKTAKHGKRIKYLNINFKSNWEVIVAKYLDKNGITWQYEPKAFDLKNGGTYTPDFYLPELDIWIEVKGWWRDKAKIKFKQFLRLYLDYNIEIWNKNKLIELNILN